MRYIEGGILSLALGACCLAPALAQEGGALRLERHDGDRVCRLAPGDARLKVTPERLRELIARSRAEKPVKGGRYVNRKTPVVEEFAFDAGGRLVLYSNADHLETRSGPASSELLKILNSACRRSK